MRSNHFDDSAENTGDTVGNKLNMITKTMFPPTSPMMWIGWIGYHVFLRAIETQREGRESARQQL